MMMGFIQAARSEGTPSVHGYSMPLEFATAPSTSDTQGIVQMEGTSADSWWRPKWMVKVLRILEIIDTAVETLEKFLEALYPPVVQSGAQGYEHPFRFKTDDQAMMAMREMGVFIDKGTIQFSKKTLAFYDENDGRSIFIKAGTYKLNSQNSATVLLVAN